MTPAELDAIIARAASVYPEDAGWDGDEAERALTTVTEDVPALAAALREAWQERDAALTLAVDIADAVEAEAHKERARIVAQTSRSLVDLARCEGHAAGANRIAPSASQCSKAWPSGSRTVSAWACILACIARQSVTAARTSASTCCSSAARRR